MPRDRDRERARKRGYELQRHLALEWRRSSGEPWQETTADTRAIRKAQRRLRKLNFIWPWDYPPKGRED